MKSTKSCLLWDWVRQTWRSSRFKIWRILRSFKWCKNYDKIRQRKGNKIETCISVKIEWIEMQTWTEVQLSSCAAQGHGINILCEKEKNYLNNNNSSDQSSKKLICFCSLEESGKVKWPEKRSIVTNEVLRIVKRHCSRSCNLTVKSWTWRG